MLWLNIVVVLWLSMPLVFANCLPVIARVWSTTPLQPIDGGAVWFDGRPVFGQSKTWEGLIWSIFFGTGISLVIGMLAVICGWTLVSETWGQNVGCMLLHMTTMSTGALLGDLGKSFIKRRVGFASGAKWPIFDQFDAVAGGFGLTALVSPAWFARELIPGRWHVFAGLCVFYFVCHQALSAWAHRKGLKSVPY